MESLQVHPSVRAEFLHHPKIHQRIVSMNILILAFFAATLVYFVVAYMGVLDSPAGAVQGGLPLWWLLLVLSFATVPAMLLLGAILMGQVKDAADHLTAFRRSQTLIIIELALGEGVAIYGLIGPLLGMPQVYRYGLMFLGLGLMAVAVAIFRNQCLDIVLMKLMEEEEKSKP